MDSKTIRGLTLALAAAVVLLSETAFRTGWAALPMPPLAGLCLIRLIQITAVLSIVYYFQTGLGSLGVTGPAAGRGLVRGMIWSLFFGCAALLGMLGLSLAGIDPLLLLKTRLPATMTDRVFFFLAGGVLAPLAEELFFRGLVFGYLRRRGFLSALLISTGLFVLAHSFSGFPLVQLVGGLVFGVCYEKERSLWAPVVIHAAGNMTLFTISLL
ncbi:type II CAAX endopeptidase family protein [Desulfatiferula olefinivorans]